MTDPLIAVRAVHFASTILLAGGLAFAAFLAEPVFQRLGSRPLLRLAELRWRIVVLLWTSLAVTVLSGAAWLVLLTTRITSSPLLEILSDDGLWSLLTETQFGRAWQVRGVLVLLLALCLLGIERSDGKTAGRLRAVAVALGAGLLGTLAWAGHAVATPGSGAYLHLAADILHLLAAGAWLGALGPLGLVLSTAHRAAAPEWTQVARDVTTRFSTMGVISVATLLATGVVNSWFLAGSLPALVGTDYGRLLLLKIALFLAMVAVAWVNRFRVTPRLSSLEPQTQKAAVRQLMRNVFVETGLGLVILVIVGMLGTLPPGLHVQPWWPFPVRLTGEVFTVPGLSTQAIISIAAVLWGALLLLSGIFVRWLGWPAIVLGLVLIVFFSRGLTLLTVEAYPTSFYRSPTGYSAQSIARGKDLFQEHCATCHGKEGRGDGRLASDPKMKPGDLTANHIYDHSEGDLFWWITAGMGDTMPGFDRALDETGRWALIDFIHANADAVRLQRTAPRVGAGFPAPDFSAECPDGAIVALEQLRGRIVHIVVAGPGSAARLRQLTGSEDGAGVTRIVIPTEASPPADTGACVAGDPDVLTVYALYRGSDAHALEGTEFLVDSTRALRSMWYPGLGQDWRDAGVLKRQIADILRTPASQVRVPSTHEHR